MDKKSIGLAILCLLLAVMWPAIVNRIYPPPPKPVGQTLATNETTVAPAPTQEVAAVTNLESTTIAPAPVAAGPVASAEPDAPRPPEEEIVIDNEFVRVVFTTYGGGIKQVVLKKYKRDVDEAEPVVLNEVTSALATFPSVPLGAIEGVAGFDAETVFVAKCSGAAVTFEATNRQGVALTKEYRVGENYLIEGDVVLRNGDARRIDKTRLVVTMGVIAAVRPGDLYELPSLSWSDGGEVNYEDVSAFDASWWRRRPARAEIQREIPKLAWSGLDNRFFCLLWMPKADSGAVSAVRTVARHAGRPVPQKPGPTDYAIRAKMHLPEFNLGAGETHKSSFQLYAGPKEYRRLQALGAGQTSVMHWGWFEWMAELLLKSMNGLYKLVRNYFFVIILITIIIKLLFWPLTQISNRSMKAMQALNPKIQALREKFKDDPQRMNVEMMKLWKQHKVNPMAGCLPTVVQIPVFIGLFYMLRSAIELRGHGFLWIHDFSQPDTIAQVLGFPVNPLPLLMGATMIWQMKITPSTADPMQQRIMMLMPLMFLIFFYNTPSGLALYWTVQNLFTIVQMKLTKHHAPSAANADSPPAPAAPPERKPKSKVKRP